MERLWNWAWWRLKPHPWRHSWPGWMGPMGSRIWWVEALPTAGRGTRWTLRSLSNPSFSRILWNKIGISLPNLQVSFMFELERVMWGHVAVLLFGQGRLRVSRLVETLCVASKSWDPRRTAKDSKPDREFMVPSVRKAIQTSWNSWSPRRKLRKKMLEIARCYWSW